MSKQVKQNINNYLAKKSDLKNKLETFGFVANSGADLTDLINRI
jgi:hypothetical protein